MRGERARGRDGRQFRTFKALAEELGVPVALVSATTGEGLVPVEEFLTGQIAVPRTVELPVLQDVPACRQWARSPVTRRG